MISHADLMPVCKVHFRQYENACGRVKNFYKEQYGTDARVYAAPYELEDTCVRSCQKFL